MTSLKMWCLLPLTVLLMSITPTESEVVQSISDCQDFLLENRSPKVPGILENGVIQDQNRYKIICQTYKDEKRFVTLYDTKNKIPVFSAFKYNGTQSGKGDEYWKIEPQLENVENKSMQDCIKGTVYNNQASADDYEGSMYARGHLFPKSYAFSVDDKTSTFTLTNAVPQNPDFNEGSWAKMETCVKCILDEYCKINSDIEGYVVTGAKPSQDKILNERVNVPSMLWSAFCCYSGNLGRWIASAYWGENVKDQPDNLETRTLQQLYDELRIDSNTFEAFPNTQCPLHETVAEFYPNMNRKCDCPQELHQ